MEKPLNLLRIDAAEILRLAQMDPREGEGSDGSDPGVRELVLLTILAGLGLGFAWAFEADYFAVVFATEAAFAGFEAIRLSL